MIIGQKPKLKTKDLPEPMGTQKDLLGPRSLHLKHSCSRFFFMGSQRPFWTFGPRENLKHTHTTFFETVKCPTYALGVVQVLPSVFWESQIFFGKGFLCIRKSAKISFEDPDNFLNFTRLSLQFPYTPRKSAHIFEIAWRLHVGCLGHWNGSNGTVLMERF
jgi:hypothetical protein